MYRYPMNPIPISGGWFHRPFFGPCALVPPSRPQGLKAKDGGLEAKDRWGRTEQNPLEWRIEIVSIT